MHKNLARLSSLGQSVWIDYVRRSMIHDGTLQQYIDDGVVGLTSNPTIFHKAIAESEDYTDNLIDLARQGHSADQIYEALVFEDIRDAADRMASVYGRSDRRDGFVSIEVNPALAHDTAGTVAEGRRIFETLDRPNVMIKVPATPAGMPAIEQLLSEGINVNVTLIFDVVVYRDVMQSFLRGLDAWVGKGKDAKAVSSVASFFVSRMDTAVDRILQKHAESGSTQAADLLGQAAVANAKLAYEAFQAALMSDDGAFKKLRADGAYVQRPLWASTSTKNPAYRDTIYVDTLVGPNTVNTMPPATLDAVLDHVEVDVSTITQAVRASNEYFDRLRTFEIDINVVTAGLLDEGVRAFAHSFNALMEDIEQSRALQVS